MKRERIIYLSAILFLLCVCTALLVSGLSANAEKQKLNKYDINEDGHANINDVTALLDYLAHGCEHEAVIDARIEPTCTEAGLTEGRHCSICEEVFVAQEEISPLGHDYVDNVCTRCGKEIPSVGDVYTFGSYEQDNDRTNGKESIEWIVLDVNISDGKALLLSKYALDCEQYHVSRTSVTWENCTLRSWLNGDFYNAAFNSVEKNRIVSTTLTNENNPRNGTNGGNDTTDNVFLLSYSDATNINYGFSSNNNVYDEARRCQPTEYAKAQGCWTSTDSNYYGNCDWWLRTPGADSRSVLGVSGNGFIGLYGDDVADYGCRDYYGSGIGSVRPAIWITL